MSWAERKAQKEVQFVKRAMYDKELKLATVKLTRDEHFALLVDLHPLRTLYQF